MKREASIDKRPQDILTLPFVKYVKHRAVFLQPKKKEHNVWVILKTAQICKIVVCLITFDHDCIALICFLVVF